MPRLIQGNLFKKQPLTFTKQWWQDTIEVCIPKGKKRIDRSLFIRKVGEGVAEFLKESKQPLTASELLNKIDSKGKYFKNLDELILCLREQVNHKVKVIEPSEPNEPYRYSVLTPHMLRKREIERYELEIADLKGLMTLSIAPEEKKDTQRAIRRYRYRLKRWEETTNSQAVSLYERLAKLGR